MMFQVPEVYGEDYYTGLSLVLWIFAIALLFVAFLLFYIKATKMEMMKLKMTQIGYGTLYFFFALTRVFFIIAVYDSENYNFWVSMGYIMYLLGLACWLYVLETYIITKTKKIFLFITLIALGIALIALIINTDESRYYALRILFIFGLFSFIAILSLYIYLIVKTTGDIRRRAMWIFIAIIFFGVGALMDSEFFISNFPAVPLEIPPILVILGTIIFYIIQLREEI